DGLNLVSYQETPFRSQRHQGLSVGFARIGLPIAPSVAYIILQGPSGSHLGAVDANGLDLADVNTRSYELVPKGRREGTRLVQPNTKIGKQSGDAFLENRIS